MPLACFVPCSALAQDPSTAAPPQETPVSATTATSIERRSPILGYGVTVGLALTLQVGRPLYLSSARQDTLETTGMPYFQANPAFWFQPQTGARCLSRTAQPEPTGTCLWHRFGIFVGRPLSYNATTSVPHEKVLEQVRELRPQAVFGVTFSPLPEFSVLAGWMFAKVGREDGTETQIGSLVIGVGGNVDLLRGGF